MSNKNNRQEKALRIQMDALIADYFGNIKIKNK